MPLTFDKVHRYTRIPGTLEMRLVETRPYVRLRRGYDPPLFVQEGVLYDEGGTVVDPWPQWVHEDIDKLSPVVRAEVGLTLPGQTVPSPSSEPAPARATSPRPKRTGEPWKCPEPGCGYEGTTLNKVFHRVNYHKPKES